MRNKEDLANSLWFLQSGVTQVLAGLRNMRALEQFALSQSLEIRETIRRKGVKKQPVCIDSPVADTERRSSVRRGRSIAVR